MIRVKICGITNSDDAQAAIDAGANLLGFNFYTKSPRKISEADAAKIRPHLPQGVEAVGVFVNAAPARVTALCQSLHLDAAQLHGDESPSGVAQVTEAVPVIKAFRVGHAFSLHAFEQYPQVFAFLLDAARAGQYGGTGRTTNWDVDRRAAQAHRIILAGGLKVENVAAAIEFVRPYGVDVASGVEAKPGKKDPGLLREFVSEVRRAEELLHVHPKVAKKS